MTEKEIHTLMEVQYLFGRLDELHKAFLSITNLQSSRKIDQRLDKYYNKLKSTSEIAYHLYQVQRQTSMLLQKKSKQKVETKEKIKPELKVIMAKIDTKVKDPVKNLELKNLVKMDRMIESDISLVAYNNIVFYVPKDIYLNQIEIFDNRSIYKNVDLVKYIDNDIMEIKLKQLIFL